MGAVEYGLVMQELERGDSGLRSFVSVQSALVMYPILQFGSADQKSRWLPLLQSGKAIGCFGLTSPISAPIPPACAPRAVPDGSGWVLNGEKTWITNGSVADVALVWARTPDDATRQGAIRASSSTRHTRLFHPRYSRQVVDARLRHIEPLLRRFAVCRSRPCFPARLA